MEVQRYFKTKLLHNEGRYSLGEIDTPLSKQSDLENSWLSYFRFKEMLAHYAIKDNLLSKVWWPKPLGCEMNMA